MVAAVARAGPNDSCAVLADENARFIVRIAMRPMALDLVESRIVVSVFQFGLRLEMGEASGCGGAMDLCVAHMQRHAPCR